MPVRGLEVYRPLPLFRRYIPFSSALVDYEREPALVSFVDFEGEGGVVVDGAQAVEDGAGGARELGC